MRKLAVLTLLAAVAITTFAGCQKKLSTTYLAPERTAQSPRASTLAYERSVRLQVSHETVAQTFAKTQEACANAHDEQCSVIESHITTGDYASAQVTIRATPAGVDKVLDAIKGQGEILSQSTTAEDLAAPIDDTEKRLGMLKDYQAKLEALRGRAGTDLDSLIKINKELAQVTSEIESATREQSNLTRRTATQLLKLDITSVGLASFIEPISTAASDFKGNLSEGIASVITGLAFLLPWGLVLAGIVWAVRKLWRRFRSAR